MNQKVTARAKHALSSRKFHLSILFFTIILFLSGLSDYKEILKLLDKGPLPLAYHKTWMQEVSHSSVISFLLPILSTLPWSSQYQEDIQTGYIRTCLPRMSVNEYAFGHLFACILSGGLLPLISYLIYYLFTFVMVLPFCPLDWSQVFSHPGQLIIDLLLRQTSSDDWYLLLFKYLLLLFFLGSFWALCGMTMSALCKSICMAYASPFILCYFLIILCERYFPDLYVINPQEWMQADVWGFGSPIPLLSEFSVILSILFTQAVSRRIQEL